MSKPDSAPSPEEGKQGWGKIVGLRLSMIFPLLQHIAGYNRQKFFADLRAAVNGAALALPQGMAYALIAGLPIQMGLFATAIAPLVNALLSHSRLTAVGPTNATAVMVSAGLVGLGAQYDKVGVMPLFVAMVGLLLIAGAVLRVASLSQFISRTVIIGYVTVAALWIILKQVGPVVGVDVSRSVSFFTQLGKTIVALGGVNFWALGSAAFSFVVWLFFTNKLPQIPALAASILVCSALIAAYVTVAPGLSWPLPELVYLDAVSISELRFTLPLPDSNLISLLAFPALAVAFLAAIENTSMAKTIAARNAESLDLNRDMFALGVANVACACANSMPASGSLTRSALNVASGAQTQFSSLFCGLFCLMGAVVLGPFTSYVPVPVLAMAVICIAISLIDISKLRVAYNATRSDMVVLLTTFFAGLFVRLDIAIFIGVATSIALFLRKVGQPALVEYSFDEQGQLREMQSNENREHPSISIIHVEGDLFFGSADLFRDHIRRIAADNSLRVIILRMRNARHLDATSVMALQELITYLRQTDRYLIVSGAMKDVYRVLKNSGTLEMLGRENVFIGSTRNPNLATRNALKRARDLIGGSANVRIYFDPNKKHQTSSS